MDAVRQAKEPISPRNLPADFGTLTERLRRPPPTLCYIAFSAPVPIWDGTSGCGPGHSRDAARQVRSRVCNPTLPKQSGWGTRVPRRARMKKFFVLLLAVCLFAGVFAFADEGMWLYNAVPKDKIKAKYNFDISQTWLDHLRTSSVRFGGGSGSFVSPDGLMFTNHHIGAGCVHDVSTKDNDYMKNGFYAESQAKEPKCPGMEVGVLVNIED